MAWGILRGFDSRRPHEIAIAAERLLAVGNDSRQSIVGERLEHRQTQSGEPIKTYVDVDQRRSGRRVQLNGNTSSTS
jgi:hypothetical protein